MRWAPAVIKMRRGVRQSDLVTPSMKISAPFTSDLISTSNDGPAVGSVTAELTAGRAELDGDGFVVEDPVRGAGSAAVLASSAFCSASARCFTNHAPAPTATISAMSAANAIQGP